MKDVEESKATAAIEQSDEAVLLKVGGSWQLTERFPDVTEVMSEDTKDRKVRVVPAQLEVWDSSLPLFLLRVREWCRKREVELDLDALPETLKRLFQLILSSEEHRPPVKAHKSEPYPVVRKAHHLVSEWKRSTSARTIHPASTSHDPPLPSKVSNPAATRQTNFRWIA